MKPYELIGNYAVLRIDADSDLFTVARDARAVVEEHPDELRNRIVITEAGDTGNIRWHWLGRAASWHPQPITASNRTHALARSNTYTHHAEVPMTGNRWIVALIALTVFAVIAGPAIFTTLF